MPVYRQNYSFVQQSNQTRQREKKSLKIVIKLSHELHSEHLVRNGVRKQCFFFKHQFKMPKIKNKNFQKTFPE